MDWKVIGVLFVCLAMIGGAFAAVTISQPTFTENNSVVGPDGKTYILFTTDINAAVSGTVVGDLNASSKCWYSITSADVNLAATWLNDVNKCSVNDWHNALPDDFNVRVTFQTGKGDVNYRTTMVYLWSDENAPTRTLSTNLMSLTMSCSDVAFNTGSGAGATDINYKINGGTSYLAGSASKTITESTPATYEVAFMCIDALGNVNASYSDNNVLLQGLEAGSATTGCGLIAWIAPLFGMLLALFVILQLMAGKFSMGLVTLAIGGIIGIVIMWAFSAAICVV